MRRELRYTRYQVLLLVGVYMYSYVLFTANHLFPIFAFYTPQSNSSAVECIGHSNSTQNATLEYSFHSAAIDLKLHCNGNRLITIITTLQVVGLLIGSGIFGIVGDNLGRKPTALISITGVILASLASTFSHNWQMLAGLRFFTGFCLGGQVVSTTNLVMEAIEPEHRIFVRTCVNFWGGSRIIYAVLAYVTKDWRKLFWVINAGVAPVIVIIACWVQESPRWLLQHNRNVRARQAIQKIAKMNSTMILESQLALLEDAAVQDRSYTYKHLFKTRLLASRTVLSAFITFACAFVSYGMDLKTGRLAGNIYLNQILIGCCILMGKPLIFFVDTYWHRFNRRHLHQSSMGIFIVYLIIVATLTHFDEPQDNWAEIVTIVVTVTGMVVIEWQWDSIYLYAAELFPTVVRSQGLGLSVAFGRFGQIFAPVVVDLSKLWKPATYVVFIFMGLLSVIISCCFLPDTKGTELPDSLEIESLAISANRRERS